MSIPQDMPKRRSVPASAKRGPIVGAPGEPGVREEILSAARGIIQRYGFRKTTMDDIARTMGRERSSLYYYFPGKRELMQALIENELADISRNVHAEVTRQKDAVSRLRVYTTCRLEQIAARAAVYAETEPDRRARADILNLAEQRRAFDEGEQRYFADLLLAGMREGQIRRLSEPEVQLFTRFAFAALRGIELEVILDPSRSADLKTEVQASLDIIFRGLLR